jgi:hypothetical protein
VVTGGRTRRVSARGGRCVVVEGGSGRDVAACGGRGKEWSLVVVRVVTCLHVVVGVWW